MRVITLTQPWASLVACGAKKVETRSWSTPYRGALAIHAGKGFAEYRKSEIEEILSRPDFRQALRPPGRVSFLTLADLPLGALIAVVRLVDCREMAESIDNPFFNPDTDFDITSAGPLTQTERHFGCYQEGRFAWILEDVVPIDPIPFKGERGLQYLSPEICFPTGQYPDWVREE